jgi:hypothetical protein
MNLNSATKIVREGRNVGILPVLAGGRGGGRGETSKGSIKLIYCPYRCISEGGSMKVMLRPGGGGGGT